MISTRRTGALSWTLSTRIPTRKATRTRQWIATILELTPSKSRWETMRSKCLKSRRDWRLRKIWLIIRQLQRSTTKTKKRESKRSLRNLEVKMETLNCPPRMKASPGVSRSQQVRTLSIREVWARTFQIRALRWIAVFKAISAYKSCNKFHSNKLLEAKAMNKWHSSTIAVSYGLLRPLVWYQALP